MKFASINGQLVPAEQATVSIFDRSFLYGDGLFETLRVTRGQPWLWEEHHARLRRGAEFLRIELAGDLRAYADKLLEANGVADAVLRIHLSRGAGPRGYSPRAAKSPVVVVSTHPLPKSPGFWKLASTSFRLPPKQTLSRFKTANRLLNVLAKAEAEEKGADEALLRTVWGSVGQGASSNLFWIEESVVCTAPEDTGILPGITRAAVLKLCAKLKIRVQQSTISPQKLYSHAVFLTLSTFGIVEAASLNGRELPRSPLAGELRDALLQLS